MVAAVNVSQDSEGAPHTQQQLSTLILTAHAQPSPVVGAGRTYRQHCVKLQLSLVGLQLLTTLSFAINTIQKNRLLSEPVRCFKGLGPGSVSQVLPAHGMVLRRLGGLASHGGMLDALPAHCNVLHRPGGLEVLLRPCLAASRACAKRHHQVCLPVPGLALSAVLVPATMRPSLTAEASATAICLLISPRTSTLKKEPALGDTSSCEAEYRAMPPANITQALKILTSAPSPVAADVLAVLCPKCTGVRAMPSERVSRSSLRAAIACIDDLFC